MKKYDLETIIPRYEKGSRKWDEMKNYSNISEHIIPFSVADMEFLNAPEIIEGLKNYLDNSVLGYTKPDDNYNNSVKNWMLKRHQWEIKSEWIKISLGVNNAFFTAVKAFTKEGEGVMLMTPVYYPMYFAINANKRVLVDNKLIIKGNKYEIDFEDFEKKAKNPNTKLLILCSPHNPTGRVWTVEELTKIGNICIENNIIVICDEIHNDIIAPDITHTVFASINEKFAQNSITCISPSKTFNLAGLLLANTIIPNEKIRNRYNQETFTTEGNQKFNALSIEACKIAYEQCEDWLDQVKEIIYTNKKIITEFLNKEFPKIKVFELEGSYLLWMDFNGLNIEFKKLAKILKEEAYLFLNEGGIFGKQGEGFERWNLACPTKYIQPALDRLKITLNKYIK